MKVGSLRKKAEEQAKKIDKEFGEEAYGGTAYRERKLNEIKLTQEQREQAREIAKNLKSEKATEKPYENKLREYESDIEDLQTSLKSCQESYKEYIQKSEQSEKINFTISLIIILILSVLLIRTKSQLKKLKTSTQDDTYNKTHCTECGKRITKKQKFCSFCGAKITANRLKNF